MNKKYPLLFTLLLMLSFPFTLFAKTLSLYEEPKDQAKVVGTVDTDVGLIAIFTPEKGDWIKVGDPRNGNVGWVKIKDLGSANTTEYTFTQRFINTGTSPQTYQIIQFGGPTKMTPEQIQQQIRQTEMQQLQMQENMNRAMQNMFNSMWFNNGAPFVMPVLVVPAQTPPATKTPDKNSNTSKTK